MMLDSSASVPCRMYQGLYLKNPLVEKLVFNALDLACTWADRL